MNEAVLMEKRQIRRINFWFGFIALSPLIAREIWDFVRDDFISVADLPLSSILQQAYSVFMSSVAPYALLGAGTLLAFYVVGFPRWRISTLQVARK